MAQTQKILDTIYGDDLDDNTTADTTNQNIRNAVETLRNRRAELYLDTPAPTTISTIGVFVKVAGSTLLSTDPDAYEISMPSDNRLRYDGVAKSYVSVKALVSMQLVAGVNQNISVAIAKNDVVLSRSEAPRLHTGTTDVSRMSIAALSVVVPTDYFEVWVANNTSTNNVTAVKLQLIVESKAIES